MNDPYDVLERQLDDAVRRRAADAATSGARRRRRGWSRLLPAIALVAVLGTGAATAAMVLGPNDQPKNQVKQALFAGQQVADASPACRGVEPRRVRLVDDPVPAGIRDQLGVLRRPATARDRLPQAETTTMKMGGGEILASSIRVARAADGWGYRISLARGYANAPVADPLRCAQVHRDASIVAAAQFSADVRAEVKTRVDRQVALLAADRSDPTFTLQFDELSPNGRTVSGGGTIIRNDTIPAIASGTSGSRSRTSIGGLVTDGVAAVRVVDESGSPRARAITIPVSDNVYHALVPDEMGPRMTAEWHDSDGNVIRRSNIEY